MSPRPVLALPASAAVTVGADSLSIVHDGDVVLEQTLGRRLGRLEATGDVTLRGGPFHGTILAGGRLVVEGDLDAEELRADVVEIGDVEVRARVIVATTRVVVGRARLTADVVVAPEVHLSPDASGRVRVVDCRNERPPAKVRGCLSLEDYEADFGDVADFLSRRGVTPVSPLPSAAPQATPPDPGRAATPPAPPEPVGEPDAIDPGGAFQEDVPTFVEGITSPALDALPDVAPPAPEPVAELEEIEDLDDAVVEVIVHEEDETGSHPVPVRPARQARVVKQVEKAWERMRAAYGDELPPTVARLGERVAAGEAAQVADEIDDLWLATLREHLAAGAPPPRLVTLAFHHLRAAAATA